MGTDVTMDDLLTVIGAVLFLLTLVMLWLFREEIMAVAGGIVAASSAEGAARRAYRRSVYAAEIMSSATPAPAPSEPSVSQTDGVQTPDQTADPAARRQKMINTYRPLRAAGMTRDAARAMLAIWSIPLDNNLWTLAAPPDAPSEPPEQRVIMMRDNGLPARPVPVDPDFPYQPMERTG